MPLLLRNQPPYYEISTVTPAGNIEGIYLSAMDSIIKSEPINKSLQDITSTLTLTDARLNTVATYISKVTTFTGMLAYQITQGNYTGDNYNGMALYKWNGTSAIKVAETTNDADIWKAASLSWVQKAFTTPYKAQPGIYFMVCIYSNSAQTTAPALGALTTLANANVWDTMVVNESASGYGIQNSVTSLPANLNSVTSHNVAPYLAMY